MKPATEIRKAWAKVQRAEKAHRQAVAELTLLLNPEQAEALGIREAKKPAKTKPSSVTYVSAMEGWKGRLSKVFSLDQPSAVLASHPWAAANIDDPVEWVQIQQAKYPGILGKTDLRDELVKALAWMNDNRRKVGGRRDAAKFLGTWVSRSMERRRAVPQRGMFEPPPSEKATDLDAPRRDR